MRNRCVDCVHVYLCNRCVLRSEADTSELLELLVASDEHDMFLPRVTLKSDANVKCGETPTSADRHLTLHAVNSTESLVEGPFQIREPSLDSETIAGNDRFENDS